MLRSIWKVIYEATFYLPDVQREMSLLETQSERDAARWHVWRALFRNWRYWSICVLAIAIVWPTLFMALPISRALCAALRLHAPVIELAIFAALSITVTLAFAFGGMWPLRRMVLRELRDYLGKRGILLCMTCGYNLHGLQAPRCPECGALT